MAASDPIVHEPVPAAAEVDYPSIEHSWRASPLLMPLLPIGAVIGIYGAASSTPSNLVRWLLAVVGLVAFYIGLDALGKRLRGPGFDALLFMAVVWVALVVLTAIFADLLPLSEARDTSKTLASPVRKRPELFSAHPLGTDNQALDILGGVIYGARISLQVSLLAVAIGLTVGGLIGVSAGYFRGALDGFVSFLTDSVLAFPPLILLLAVVTGLEPNARNIALALALISIPTMARLARANTLTFAQREFVLAAKAMGATNRRIIFRELVPNVVRPMLSYAFLIIAVLIVAEASLSFLGVGIQRPTPSWGNMMAAGQERFDQHPHIVFIPGTVMFLTVFAINRLGEKARQMWDPRQGSI